MQFLIAFVKMFLVYVMTFVRTISHKILFIIICYFCVIERITACKGKQIRVILSAVVHSYIVLKNIEKKTHA